MDKSLILNKIIQYKNLKSDAEFARFLDITPQNFSKWKQRGTYDIELLYKKCPDLNPEWLLTGEGSMLKNDDKSGINQNVVGNGVTMVGGSVSGSVKSSSGGADDIIKELQKQLKDKDKEIERLKTQIDKLFKMIPL